MRNGEHFLPATLDFQDQCTEVRKIIFVIQADHPGFSNHSVHLLMSFFLHFRIIDQEEDDKVQSSCGGLRADIEEVEHAIEAVDLTSLTIKG